MEKTHRDPFLHYVGLSFLGHIFIVLVFTVKFIFFPSEDIIIQNAIRVDMVALPDKKMPSPIVEEKKAPEPKKVNLNKTPEKKDAPKLTQAKQNKALERLKALSALDKLKKEVETKKQETTLEKEELYKGNIITKGSDLKGLSKLQYDEYFAKLESHVKESWVLPQWLANSQLKAQVRVTIDERGYVTSKEIVTSSGNSVFDGKALEAMDKASPCPIAPKNLQTLIAKEGIIFNFP
ncbi:MAG: TonB family protein [Bdellovibrionales bacterium]|nr:TonB family protein [Bdellovibrionales bacterium]